MKSCPKCNAVIITVITRGLSNFAAMCEQCGHVYKSTIKRSDMIKWLLDHCEIKATGEVHNPPPDIDSRGLFGAKGYGTVTNPTTENDDET